MKMIQSAPLAHLNGPSAQTQNPPVAMGDITRGVWGAPFQRTQQERKAWRELLETALADQRIVTVHCRIETTSTGAEIRIHRTTYLRDQVSGACARLIHAENIAHPPNYTKVGGSRVLNCTLHFEALPDGCTLFDLEEHTTEPFPFNARSIQRNRMDVYRVTLRENAATQHSTNNQ